VRLLDPFGEWNALARDSRGMPPSILAQDVERLLAPSAWLRARAERFWREDLKSALALRLRSTLQPVATHEGFYHGVRLIYLQALLNGKTPWAARRDGLQVILMIPRATQ